MAECYNCGAYIPKGQGYRREVYTGHSNRIYFGRRLSGSTGNRYGVRTICASCVQRIADRRRRTAITVVAIIAFLYVASLFDNSSSNRTSPSAAGTGATASSLSYPGASTREIPPAVARGKKSVRRGHAVHEGATPRSFVAHDELWIVTRDSDVLTSESVAVAHVHAGHPIHVIGVSNDGVYLQIVMHDGRRGLVAASAARFDRGWIYD
jgi:hypothetical protein